jgi:hypothetical protein
MSTCYRCGQPLAGDQISLEHLFPQAIGGKTGSRDLLCKTCNAKWGQNPDAGLTKSLMSLSTALNVRRASGRGDHPKIVGQAVDGTAIKMDSKGKPELEKFTFQKSDLPAGKKNIQFVARSDDEARRVLTELKEKHPQIDVEKELASAQRASLKFTEPAKFPSTYQIPEMFRSLLKTALNFLVMKKGNRVLAQKFIPIIDGTMNAREAVFWSLDLDPFPAYTQTVTHTIAVVANSAERLMYAQVTVFGFFRILVLLDDNYTGEEFSCGHVENPLGSDPPADEVPKPVVFGRAQINAIKQTWPTEAILQSYVSGISVVAQHRQNTQAIVERAKSVFLENLTSGPQGEPITSQAVSNAVAAMRAELLGQSSPSVSPIRPSTPSVSSEGGPSSFPSSEQPPNRQGRR